MSTNTQPDAWDVAEESIGEGIKRLLGVARVDVRGVSHQPHIAFVVVIELADRDTFHTYVQVTATADISEPVTDEVLRRIAKDLARSWREAVKEPGWLASVEAMREDHPCCN